MSGSRGGLSEARLTELATGPLPATSELGAYVTALVASRDGARIAIGLGDGTVRVLRPGDPGALTTLAIHEGACLGLVRDLDGNGFLSGGDDGRLVAVAADGGLRELGRWPGRWVDTLAVTEELPLRAVALGREVLLIDAAGATRQTLPHSSTVAGLAFDPSGQRLAAAHYGGVTLWIRYRDGWQPTLLPWKGSHLAVTWSPNGKFIVSSMQEAALHGWRLADKKDMAMRGYPSKIRSTSWAMRGRWLATSGAEVAVLWPFRDADGPLGKAPYTIELGAELVTAVAAHPRLPLLALGAKDGTVALARIEEGDRVILRAPAQGAVTVLAWTPDGGTLAGGTEAGWVGLWHLAGR